MSCHNSECVRGHMSHESAARTSRAKQLEEQFLAIDGDLIPPGITGYALILAASTPMQLTSWATTSNTLSTGRLH